MVIGGADTGCQIASIFADFGVTVRLVEFAPGWSRRRPQRLRGAAHGVRSPGIQVETGSQVTDWADPGTDRRAVHP